MDSDYIVVVAAPALAARTTRREPVEETYDDPNAVKIQYCADPTNDVERSCGIQYQRCGGGRRVIRKRIGGN